MDTLFDSVAETLVNQSCQLIVVFAIAAIGAWLLKNQSAHWRYLLWLLVIAKCIAPCVVDLPVAILPAETEVEHSPAVAHLDLPRTYAPKLPSVAVDSETMPPQENRAEVALQSMPVATLPTSVVVPEVAKAEDAKTSLSSWLVLGWVVGCTVFLTMLIGKMLETQWRLRRLRTPADEKIQTQISSLASETSLRRAPRVFVVEGTSQPFVFGWLRGSVYLPECFADIESAEHQTAILAHELAHVVRLDAVFNLLQMIVQSVFFFHPLVWFANRKLREEREKCCDEFVLADTTTSPKGYCEAIVKMLDREKNAGQFRSVLAVGGSVRNIEDRILTVLTGNRKFRRGPSFTSFAILGLVAVIALPSAIVVTQATVTAAVQDEDKTEEAEQVDWPKGQTMEFYVIDAETKKPLPGVDLELQYAGKGIDFSDVKVQTTDADGLSIITLPSSPIKSMRVYPSKPSFVPLRVYWAAEPTPVLPKTVTIPLQPGKTIGGTIIDEDGNPVPGVEVSMHYWAKSEGKGHGDSPDVRVNICRSNYNGKGIGTSDKDGRWKLDVLPATVDTEKFHLYFNHSDFISDHVVRGLISRSKYEMPSLEKLYDLSVETVLKKGQLVQGVVTNKDGNPISLAKVFAFDYDCRIEEPVATTGMDGEFAFSWQINNSDEMDLLPGRSEAVGFLVQAEGYAPELIEPNGDDKLSVQLNPGKSLRGRVVDIAGKPMEKAVVWAQNWRGKRGRVRAEARTDVDGRFELKDLPADEIEYDIGKPGMMSIDEFPMVAGAKEYTLTLTPPLTVKATVTDVETGELIEDSTYIVGFEYEDGRAPDWQNYPKPRIRSGKFEKVFRQIGFPQRIRVDADGYEPGISQIIEAKKDSGEYSLEIEFKLKKGDPIVGSAIGIEGKPLVGAKVVLARARMNISNRHLEVYDGQNPVTTTDAEGKFQFPPETQRYCLVVIHEDGVGMITEKEMDPDSPIQIEPWDEKNKQMQIIRLPSEMGHSDFPKYDPFEEKRKREKAKKQAPPVALLSGTQFEKVPLLGDIPYLGRLFRQ